MSENKPAYIKPIVPSQKRRAKWNDYCSARIYMVTLSASRKDNPFGFLRVNDSPRSAYVDLTDTGKIVDEHIKMISHFTPQIRILSYVVMPDHCHILLHVTERIPKPLGNVIRAFTSSVTSRTGSAKPVFEKGFHDRILLHKGQLGTLLKYIKDNPYRLAIKRSHPDLFRRYLHLRIGGREYAAYGNIFLLKDYDRSAVIVHSKYTENELADLCRKWHECAINHGVLISAFISRKEKEIRQQAIELGGKIIQIKPDGLPQRFKPMGSDFNLCSDGRMLILAPWPDSSINAPLTRSRALNMNMLAQELATAIPPLSLHINRNTNN